MAEARRLGEEGGVGGEAGCVVPWEVEGGGFEEEVRPSSARAKRDRFAESWNETIYITKEINKSIFVTKLINILFKFIISEYTDKA
jgi:hypothetical protein